jgi:hypothetical protein
VAPPRYKYGFSFGYRPCGVSPRLRIPLGAAASKAVSPPFRRTALVARAMLPATSRVVLLRHPAFSQKSCVGPVDRNQPRPQRFPYRELAWAGRRKRADQLHLLTFNARAAPGLECGERDRHETRIMLIRFGYELTFNCAEPTLMVCLLDAHRDHAPNSRFATPFETTPAISTGTYFDTFSPLCYPLISLSYVWS